MHRWSDKLSPQKNYTENKFFKKTDAWHIALEGVLTFKQNMLFSTENVSFKKNYIWYIVLHWGLTFKQGRLISTENLNL